MPPALPGETDGEYTDRLTGADGTDRQPYDHRRNRQCSIGYHEECSDPAGDTCECPCHKTPARGDDELDLNAMRSALVDLIRHTPSYTRMLVLAGHDALVAELSKLREQRDAARADDRQATQERDQCRLDIDTFRAEVSLLNEQLAAVQGLKQ
jgi:hypothetical protein